MAELSDVSRRSSADDVAFFGHPRGLAYIVATEGGYAFAYYGMVTILTLYMTQQLFMPGHVENILGFGAYRHAMQTLFGVKTPLALASMTFGLATSLGYLTPMIGGLLGDRWLGQKRTVVLGLVLLTVGFSLLITEQGFLIALLFVVSGAGLVKSNLLAQVGRLYEPGDPRRTRAFGIFLIAVNVGGFLTPLVVGSLGEKVGWAQGLMAAAGGMAFGLTAYLLGLRHMPVDALAEARRNETPVRLAPHDWRVIAALMLVLIAATLNTGTYNQVFNIFPVWAKSHVDLNLFGFQMPVTWFSAFDGVFTIIGIALALRIWAWQSARGAEPRETSRVAVGCALTGLGFLILALASLATPATGKMSVAAPIALFILADCAIPWVDTVLQALFTKAAPTGTATTMLGVYYLSFAMGNFLVGWLGSFYETMSPSLFWLLHSGIGAGAVLFLILAAPGLNRLLYPPSAAAR